MKVSSLLAFYLFVLVRISHSKYNHRLTKVECNASNKSISELFCFMRAFNRRHPVGNFGFNLNRKIKNGMVSSTVLFLLWKLWTNSFPVCIKSLPSLEQWRWLCSRFDNGSDWFLQNNYGSNWHRLSQASPRVDYGFEQRSSQTLQLQWWFEILECDNSQDLIDVATASWIASNYTNILWQSWSKHF